MTRNALSTLLGYAARLIYLIITIVILYEFLQSSCVFTKKFIFVSCHQMVKVPS